MALTKSEAHRGVVGLRAATLVSVVGAFVHLRAETLAIVTAAEVAQLPGLPTLRSSTDDVVDAAPAVDADAVDRVPPPDP
jgi:hypothetical protein